MQATQAQNGEAPPKKGTSSIGIPQILFFGVLHENPKKMIYNNKKRRRK